VSADLHHRPRQHRVCNTQALQPTNGCEYEGTGIPGLWTEDRAVGKVLECCSPALGMGGAGVGGLASPPPSTPGLQYAGPPVAAPPTFASPPPSVACRCRLPQRLQGQCRPSRPLAAGSSRGVGLALGLHHRPRQHRVCNTQALQSQHRRHSPPLRRVRDYNPTPAPPIIWCGGVYGMPLSAATAAARPVPPIPSSGGGVFSRCWIGKRTSG
jgi:hypothetical protein